jgi:hypothetical protein
MAAFSFTTLGKTILPGLATATYGSCSIGTVSGTTTGNIDTGLAQCDFMGITHYGSSVEVMVGVANETFPCAGNAVTVIGSSGDNLYWYAVGR